MKTKRWIALVLAVLMIGAIFAGCAQTPAAPTGTNEGGNTTAPETGKKTIAYITPSTTTPFWNWIENGIKDQCKVLGYEVIVYDSGDDSAKQLANAQNAITKKVDGIVISPTDSSTCPAVLDEAKAAGIPVVICDIGTDSGEYLSLVSTPNFDGAYEVGTYLAKYIKDNNLNLGPIGEITVPLSRINGQNRYNGFQKAMDEAGIKVTTVLEGTAFTLDEAENQTRNIVTANSGLVAVFAHHAQATLGAVAALDDLGLGSGKVLVAAFDGDPDIVDNLKAGKVLVCGAQQAKKMGREAVSALDNHFAGKTVEKEIQVPVLLLTAENVEKYIDAIDKDVCGLE